MNYKSCYQAKNKGVKHMDVQAGGSYHNRQIIESDYKSELLWLCLLIFLDVVLECRLQKAEIM